MKVEKCCSTLYTTTSVVVIDRRCSEFFTRLELAFLPTQPSNRFTVAQPKMHV